MVSIMARLRCAPQQRRCRSDMFAASALLPDEIIRINDTARRRMPCPTLLAARRPRSATFDVSADGLLPVTRNHMQVIAAGLGVYSRMRHGIGRTRCCGRAAIEPAGLSTGFTCWFLSGGTLALHHAFDAGGDEAAVRRRELRRALRGTQRTRTAPCRCRAVR